MVKRLRHRSFKAVTGVRFPLGPPDDPASSYSFMNWLFVSSFWPQSEYVLAPCSSILRKMPVSSVSGGEDGLNPPARAGTSYTTPAIVSFEAKDLGRMLASLYDQDSQPPATACVTYAFCPVSHRDTEGMTK